MSDDACNIDDPAPAGGFHAGYEPADHSDGTDHIALIGGEPVFVRRLQPGPVTSAGCRAAGVIDQNIEPAQRRLYRIGDQGRFFGSPPSRRWRHAPRRRAAADFIGHLMGALDIAAMDDQPHALAPPSAWRWRRRCLNCCPSPERACRPIPEPSRFLPKLRLGCSVTGFWARRQRNYRSRLLTLPLMFCIYSAQGTRVPAHCGLSHTEIVHRAVSCDVQPFLFILLRVIRIAIDYGEAGNDVRMVNLESF